MCVKTLLQGPSTYSWIVPYAPFTHIHLSMCPQGWGRRRKKSSPAVWAIPLHACVLGRPLNHWPLIGGAFQDGGSMVKHSCVFHATRSTDTGQLSRLELYWISSDLKDGRMSFQCSNFKECSRISQVDCTQMWPYPDFWTLPLHMRLLQ